MTDLIFQNDGVASAIQLLLLVGSLAIARREILGAWGDLGRRSQITYGLLVAAGTLLPLLLFPTERYSALGHEASYFEVFTGQSTPSNSAGWHPYVTYPALRWLYWGIGALFGSDSGALPLLVLNALFSGLSVGLFAWFARVFTERESIAATAGLLMLLSPNRLFWGAAIFHTAIPYSFAVACLLFTILAWRSGERRMLLAAAACGISMAALRIEWGIMAPALALLLCYLRAPWGRHPGVLQRGFWIPALALTAVGAVFIVGLGGALTEQGGYHSIAGYLGTIGRQALFLRIFDPWLSGLGVVAIGLGLLSYGSRPEVGLAPVLGMLVFVLVSHLGLATFNDYGYRHALVPSTMLVLSIALLAPGMRASMGIVRLGSTALLTASVVTALFAVAEARARYYATEEQFAASDPDFAQGSFMNASELVDGNCFLVTDDEELWDYSRRRLEAGKDEDQMVGSHFNLMDPGEAVIHFRSHGGCVRWLFDGSQFRWDSMGARVRAAKMHYWFSWKREGVVRFPWGLDAVVYRMASPPWGVSNDEPVPPTEFLLPGQREGASDDEPPRPPAEEQSELESAP